MGKSDNLQVGIADNPWALNEPEPTALIALYPGHQPPTLDEILTKAAKYLTVPLEIVKHLEPDDQHFIFSIVAELPFLKHNAVIFAEPAQPLSKNELDDPAATNCKWVIGIETLLDPMDAHSNFVELVRFLAKSVADCPAIMDVNCERWLPQEMLEKMFFTQIDKTLVDPPEDVLWFVHAISHKESDTAWVHTHGLWRCGNPELEMLQVPINQVQQAFDLINTIAERLLEEKPPDYGCDMQIGPQMNVTLQPWQKIAPKLAPNLPGSMTDRTSDPENPHIGVRAVICGAISQEDNTYPFDVIMKLSSSEFVMFPAIRVVDRLAALARATWPLLVKEFNKLPVQCLQTEKIEIKEGAEKSVSCTIKACLMTDDNPAESQEHLWFAVHQFKDNGAQAKLLTNPILKKQPIEDDMIWIKQELISDWSVTTPFNNYDPSQFEELAIELNELKQGITI